MFGFIKKVFLVGLTVLSYVNPLSTNQFSYISMTNKECKVRPEIINVNSDEPVFYPFSIKTSKCSGSCNNINDPYAKMCVGDVLKILNVKVFNLMSRTNEIRHIKWHETCNCKCRLDASVCNNKQHWNKDKCCCGCKKLIDKGACDEGFIWNPSNCECECDKSCDVGEYLEYKNCKCRKNLVDKLTEKCIENIDEIKIASKNEHKNKCSSCTLYIVLFSIFFTINIGIGAYFVYYKFMNHDKETAFRYGYVDQTTINKLIKWEKSNK